MSDEYRMTYTLAKLCRAVCMAEYKDLPPEIKDALEDLFPFDYWLMERTYRDEGEKGTAEAALTARREGRRALAELHWKEDSTS